MSIFLDSRFNSLAAYTPGEQPRDMEYIKLNTNESPFPPAPKVCEALNGDDVEMLRLYSDPSCKTLKEKLATLYGVKSQNIFVSNGSDDILNFAFMAYACINGVCFPDITYGFYSVFANLHGADSEIIPLKNDFSLDYNDYVGKGKLIVIANPNAPTGLTIPVWQIEEIVKTNPKNVVVIDEAYIDFGGESCYNLTEKYSNLLVVRTFSKSRCLAGGRLGYAIACEDIIADLEKIKFSTNPYSINRLTLKLGEITVDEEWYYKEKCAEIVKAREYTKNALEELGFFVTNGNGNFLFAKCDRINGEDMYIKLREKGILVRHFSAERIKDFNRITIGSYKQMEAFINTVKYILGENQ